MSERNGELPLGWMAVPFGELCMFAQNGCSTRRSASGLPTVVLRLADVSTDGRIASQNLREIKLSEQDRQKYALKRGDLLAYRVNGSPRIVGQVVHYSGPDGYAFCDHFIRFRTGNTVLDPEFAALAFRVPAVRKLIEARMVSSAGQNTVSQSSFAEISFPLPPFAEQRRIVAKIEALQERSRRVREALAEVGPLLEQFRQSVLAAAFRGDLTADWRTAHPDIEPASELLHRIRAERRRRWEQAELAKYEARGQKPPKHWQDKYEEPESVEAANLPKLPAGWRYVNVDEIATKVTDGVHKKPNYVESGIPFLTIKNLTSVTGISFSDTRFVTESDHQEFIKRAHPEKGDILVTKDGTLGVVRIIESEQLFSIFVSLALIKPVFRYISPFLAWMLQSPQGQAGMKVTGTGLQHIHLVDLRATVIPLPPEAELQVIVKRIEERLEGIDIIFDEVIRCLEDLDQLDQAILAKAFRGELVPQDPDDEPASALLARIREQKTQQAEAAKRRQKTSVPQQRNKAGKESPRPTPQQLTLAEVLSTQD